MNNHFENGLNVRDLILMKRPKYVVELGAGSGENTRQLLSLMDIYDFKMVTISTGGCPSDVRHEKFRWIDGVSYLELPKIDGQIDFCSIDTDHNYWTLKAELDILKVRMNESAMIVLHDTETYAKHDGCQFGYDGHGKVSYPDISSHGKSGLQIAICELVCEGDFRIYSHTAESCGATALIRGGL